MDYTNYCPGICVRIGVGLLRLIEQMLRMRIATRYE